MPHSIKTNSHIIPQTNLITALECNTHLVIRGLLCSIWRFDCVFVQSNWRKTRLCSIPTGPNDPPPISQLKATWTAGKRNGGERKRETIMIYNWKASVSHVQSNNKTKSLSFSLFLPAYIVLKQLLEKCQSHLSNHIGSQDIGTNFMTEWQKLPAASIDYEVMW